MAAPHDTALADTLPTDPGETAPRRLPAARRYELKGLLARGGQSEVYVALDHELGREVAFKRPRPDANGEVPSHVEARFLREARITARLDHPNVITVHEIGRDPDGRLFCTQRLVRGNAGGPPETLAQALKAARTLPQRLSLLPRLVDVCTGVAHAHARGVVHRDLKPDNVVLGGPNETVVLDWGLARELAQPDPLLDGLSKQEARTADGQVFGTPLYMSPEQAFGKRDLVDARSDVWSLGVMLYELLAGRAPWRGQNPVEVIEEVRAGTFAPVTQHAPDAPPELVAIAARAMAREREARYADANALASDVRAWLEGRQVGVYSYSARELLRLFVRRHRTTTAVGSVGLVLVLLAVAGLVVSNQRTRESLSEAFVEKARLAEGSLRWNEAAIWYAAALEQARRDDAAYGFQLASRRAAERPVTKLRGHKLGVRALAATADGAWLASGGSDGVVRLWNVGAATLAAELPGHTDAVTGLAFSGDGTALFSVSEDHSVRRWNVATRRSEVLATLPDTLNVVATTADGSRVYTGCETGEVFEVTPGQPARALGRHEAWPVYALALSPDGAELASGAWNGEVKRWRLPEGALLDTTAAHVGSVLSLAWSPQGSQLASSGRDATVRLWGTAPEGLSLVHVLSGHTQRVYGVAWNETGSLLASAGSDGTVRTWLPATGVPLRSMSIGDADEFAAVRVLRGERLAWAGRSGVISLRTVAAPDFTNLLPATVLPRLSTGELLMPRTHAFAVLNPATLQPLALEPSPQALQRTEAPSGALAASPDDGLLVGACGLDCLAWFDLRRHQALGTTPGHGKGLEGLAFSPDGRWLVSVGRDSAVRVWDVATRSQSRVLAGHTHGSYGVAFSADGQWLATSGYDKRIILWNAVTFEEVRRLAGHEHGVRKVAFSPDGKRLASAGWDRSARVWDVATGKELARYYHQDFVFGLDWRPDGALLATGSHDGTVRLWDTRTHRELARFSSDETQATAVRFSADGTVLFYAGRSPHRIELTRTGAEPSLQALPDKSDLRLEGLRLEPRTAP